MICHYTCSTTLRGQLLLAASRLRKPEGKEGSTGESIRLAFQIWGSEAGPHLPANFH
ncbi:mCG1038122 [Mus musculus]|uniref:Fibroblast growth factor 12, isoform CRA_d n=1 Tax=Rattus norvegicus TaxID=10116 RepID=A6JRX4_RAT|nr:mCG1038122 [Mus musculus]EDL78133.1 fibroblast growth factor 12, isoform CRA_d [Rattus norvegicus]